MAIFSLLFLSLTIALGGYLIWSVTTLALNYRRALAMGIPIILQPVSQLNVLWMVLESYVFRVLAKLPIGLGSFKYSQRGWFFAEKDSSHVKYGPAFAIVTPREVSLYVADPEVFRNIYSRRTDFVRPQHMYKVLEVYGPLISTVGTSEWPRHRKLLAPPFNESIMNLVWEESISQARAMLVEWTAASNDYTGVPSTFTTGHGSIRSVSKDARTLSLNVLSSTGFKRSYSFSRAADRAEIDGIDISYREALATVLDNSVFLMLVPYRLLQLPVPMPASWVNIGKAATAFRQYMVRIINEEMASLSMGKAGSGGLMTGFVRALEIGVREKGGLARKGLSMDEILGNLFGINFAGHDTTANTLAFTMLLLAAYPETQDWLREELHDLSDPLDGKGRLSYTDIFPRLVRTRAVLFETLRLYPPIPQLPKSTNDKPQTLPVKDFSLLIPPRTSVSLDLLAVHTDPEYWGPDPLSWRPSRWIAKPQSPGANEELITPRPFTYVPWSDGPQNCLGEKFSQVEVIAVLATLFSRHRILGVREAGEPEESARGRILDTIEDCDMQMLLRMRDADRIELRCTKLKD